MSAKPTAKPKATPADRVRAAFAKAVTTGAFARVRPLEQNEFEMTSSTGGTVYAVSRTRGSVGPDVWECDCPAGKMHPVCYHRAAVFLFLEWINGADPMLRDDGDVYLVRKASASYAGFDPFHGTLLPGYVPPPPPAEPFDENLDLEPVVMPCPRCDSALNDKGNCACCDYSPGNCECPATADRFPPAGVPFDVIRDDQSDEYERPDPGEGDDTCKHGNVVYRSGDCELCEQEEEPDTDDSVHYDPFEPADVPDLTERHRARLVADENGDDLATGIAIDLDRPARVTPCPPAPVCRHCGSGPSGLAPLLRYVEGPYHRECYRDARPDMRYSDAP